MLLQRERGGSPVGQKVVQNNFPKVVRRPLGVVKLVGLGCLGLSLTHISLCKFPKSLFKEVIICP